MTRRHGLAVPVSLAALLALPGIARAQDGKTPPKVETPAVKEVKEEEPPPLPEPSGSGETEDEAPVDVKGSRFRLKLRNGSQIEGVLPRGVVWERLDEAGEYSDCKETDKGAGLRLQYVLNLEGDLFIRKSEIAEGGIRDLGALTEEQKVAIKEQILAQRRKVLEDRERVLREEIKKLAAEAREQERKVASDEARKQAEEEKVEEAEILRGEELLEKFPPSEWSELRLKEILRREVVNGIFRNDVEREFIDNFKAWKAALERTEKAKGAQEGAGTGGEKKKETPPAEGGK